MYNRKIWEETWFGDIDFSGRKTKTRRGGGKRGKRGGRRR
jgi:hypothetical protein